MSSELYPNSLLSSLVGLHAIDFEDVALTMEGLRIVQMGAQTVVQQFMPSVDCDKLTSSQALALFVDRLYWDERSGGLIMCTDMVKKSLCLPIPREYWMVRKYGGDRVQ